MYSAIDANRRKSAFLIALFVGVVAGVGAVYGYVTDSGPFGLVFAFSVSVGMTFVSWFAGDKIVLATSGAQEITEREQNPYLWNLVENLCITSGQPRPRIYLINDPALNAFATGRDPEHASIAVTAGLLQRLENEELEGVIAHELSHIKNYDIRAMLLAAVLVGSLTLLGDIFLRSGLRHRRRNEGGGILAILGIVTIVISPIVGELIKLAISRQREYLADASGALLTRYPEGLARALEKISASAQPVQRASQATAHLWVSDPFAGEGLGARVSRLFSTHPPVQDRIRRLREMGG
jgi:heat shock protein HtpX